MDGPLAAELPVDECRAARDALGEPAACSREAGFRSRSGVPCMPADFMLEENWRDADIVAACRCTATTEEVGG